MLLLIVKILILSNIKDKKELYNFGNYELDAIYFSFYDQDLAFQQREVVNDLIIDIFLVLTSEEQALNEMKKKNLLPIFDKISSKLNESENLKDRLFVITNYLAN